LPVAPPLRDRAWSRSPCRARPVDWPRAYAVQRGTAIEHYQAMHAKATQGARPVASW